VAKLVLAIQVCALMGVALTLQACCCGGLPLPSPGPPGAITGLIDWAPTDTPADLAVYAIDSYSQAGAKTYAMTHVSAGNPSYSIQVPPGVYYVAARLDSAPMTIGAYTFHVACVQTASCDTTVSTYALPTVRVESTAVMAGIDIGDWGMAQARHLILTVDLYGSPASLIPHYSPSPKALASRSFPPASNDLTQTITRQIMGLTARFPAGWHEIQLPQDGYGYSENAAYFSNEAITSPLGLDSSGVWMTAVVLYSSGCPFPDWRYATARATVPMQGGSNHFFFEDPQPSDGPQPFSGYSVRGGDFAFSDCVDFIMIAPTQQALDANLPLFAALVETAAFFQPCGVCSTPS
jgi:hypothetical protein